MTTTALPTGNFVSTERLESEIRSNANAVVNAEFCRRTHPSYGYTKTDVRERAQRLRGVVGLYSLITGQSSHTEVSPLLVEFQDPSTRDAVVAALTAVNNLKDSK